jgi:hypothetical protein
VSLFLFMPIARRLNCKFFRWTSPFGEPFLARKFSFRFTVCGLWECFVGCWGN